MRKYTRSILIIGLLSLAVLSLTLDAGWGQSSKDTAQYDEGLYKAMRWRCIGPFRGGRVTAVTGIFGKPYTYYF